MTDDETKILRQELESLQAQLAQLKASQSKDRADSAKAFNELDDNCFRHISDLRAAQDIDRKALYESISTLRKDTFQYIADIHDLLWPVFHKAFPEYAETKKRLDTIMKRGRTDAKKP